MNLVKKKLCISCYNGAKFYGNTDRIFELRVLTSWVISFILLVSLSPMCIQAMPITLAY